VLRFSRTMLLYRGCAVSQLRQHLFRKLSDH
jgi:hypothetical protein